MYSFRICNLTTRELLTCGSGFTDARKIYRILDHYQKANPTLSLCIYLTYTEE